MDATRFQAELAFGRIADPDKDLNEDSLLARLNAAAFAAVRLDENHLLLAATEIPREWTPADRQTLRDLASTWRPGRVQDEQPSARSASAAAGETRRRTALLEQLFRSAPEAIVLLDNAGHVLRVNHAFIDLFGFSEDEVTGRRVDDLIVAPEGHNAATCITRAIAAGETVSTQAERVRKNGSAVHVSILGAPIHLEGERIGVYGIYRDISAELQAESHARWLIDHTPLGIFSVDGNGRFLDANAAGLRILGRDLPTLRTLAFHDVVAEDSLAEAEARFRERLAGGDPLPRTELHLVRPDGERRLLHVTLGEPQRFGGGIRVHGIARDITEEKAREAQARRAERLSSVASLLGGVAHELNNPLTSIKSFAELLLMDERPGEEREAIEVIRKEATRASTIIDDLQALARQTREHAPGERDTTLVNEHISRVIDMRQGAMQTAGIEVQQDLAWGLPCVTASRSEIEQIVLNLIVNAERALRSLQGERRLRVRTRGVRGGIEVSIIDNGPGIDPAHIDRIFDPFWTTQEPGAGTGLGLTLAHDLVSHLDGIISVESAPGEGTCFRVFLPPSPAAPAAPAAAPPAQGMQPLRVLVIEDQATVRRALVRQLEQRGHSVMEAGNGVQALDLLLAGSGESFDVIVSDVRMPGMDGGQLLREIGRSAPALVERLIFLTGETIDSACTELARDAGIPMLSKPIEMEELLREIERRAAGDREEAAEAAAPR